MVQVRRSRGDLTVPPQRGRPPPRLIRIEESPASIRITAYPLVTGRARDGAAPPPAEVRETNDREESN